MKQLKKIQFGEQVAQSRDLKYETVVKTEPVSELSTIGNVSYDIVASPTLRINLPEPEAGLVTDFIVRVDNTNGTSTTSVSFNIGNDYDTFDYNLSSILSGEVKYYLFTWVGNHWLIGGKTPN